MTSVSYLGNSDGQVTLTIRAPSTTSNGRSTEVTDTSTAVSITKGNTQKVSGHQIFRVEVGEPSISDRVTGEIIWLNSDQASQVLSNPNSYIDIGFFHDSGADPSGGCPADQFKTKNQLGTDICVTSSAANSSFSSQLLTPMLANGLISSETADQQYLYVLATINVPGGGPPGQQALSGTLDFHLQLTLR